MAYEEELTMTEPGQHRNGASGHANDKESVVVVVNGAATVVAFHGNPTLLEIVTQALGQTQNSGQPVENWELRAPDGTPLLDLTVHVKKLDLADNAELFLNLRAGIGG
jgi:hypothetical protein